MPKHATTRIERQQLRKKQRALRESIIGDRDELCQPESTRFTSALRSADDLFEQVRRPRELALDNDILHELSRVGSERARRLDIATNQYSVSTFLAKVRSRFPDDDNPQFVDLVALGRFARRRALTSPGVDFLLGSIQAQAEGRTVRQRERRTRVTGAIEQPVRVDAESRLREMRPDEKHQTWMNRMFEILSEKGEVKFFELVTNPDPENGFTQTVENIFAFSFLLRFDRVSLFVRDDELICKVKKFKGGNQMIQGDDEGNVDDSNASLAGVQTGQLITTLSLASWQSVVQMYDIRTSMIPTRYQS